MNPAISLRGLSKRYRVRHPRRPHTLHEALARGFGRHGADEAFWALRDVDLVVPRGRTVALIGPNGAGKSTLLRLVARVGRPDSGTIVTHGRLGALLDLGAGFHTDLTGRENVLLGGVICGLTRREVRRRFDAIVDFSGLEEFIDNPLRTYSTGMRMRLAFSVTVIMDPEILLIDEVLTVGDLAFQRKCLRRMADLQANGCTLMFSSHGELVRQACHDAVWLDRGRLVRSGPAGEVLAEYERDINRSA